MSPRLLVIDEVSERGETAYEDRLLVYLIVQFVTGRYCDNPLIIRGPGAGPAVTAGGIFADLLRLCSMLSGNHN